VGVSSLVDLEWEALDLAVLAWADLEWEALDLAVLAWVDLEWEVPVSEALDSDAEGEERMPGMTSYK